MMNALSSADLVAVLRHRCEASGTQDAWAKANLISPTMVNLVLHGRRDPSERIAAALGFTKKVVFVSLHTGNESA